jgi:two-component system, OmpR family, response regulator CpxR
MRRRHNRRFNNQKKCQWPEDAICYHDTLQNTVSPLASASDKFFTNREKFPLASKLQAGLREFRRCMKPKRTILCVDDNEQSLSYRKIMLETRGYRVASYSHGEEALDRFKQGGIDLVVTDMGMPGLDGPQLIAAVKKLSPQIPAILISSKVRIYNHDSQADVFLAKGMYAPADLLERIRLLLVRKRGPKRMQDRIRHFPQQGAA